MQEGKEGIRRSQRLLQLSEKFFRKAGGNGNLRQAGSAGDKNWQAINSASVTLSFSWAGDRGAAGRLMPHFSVLSPMRRQAASRWKGFSLRYRYFLFPRRTVSPASSASPQSGIRTEGCDIQLSVGEAEIPENAPQGLPLLLPYNPAVCRPVRKLPFGCSGQPGAGALEAREYQQASGNSPAHPAGWRAGHRKSPHNR